MIKITLLLTVAFAISAQAKPLKVFILAGQSNMEGQASVVTFDYIGDDPATAPLLKMMRDADGKPTVVKDTWISYFTGANDKNFLLHGPLTAGYGSMWGQDPTKPGDKIGPEFTFGLVMNKALGEPILIIKIAWGGKSLHTDFRPPSAGSYVLAARTKELWDKHPQGAHGIPKLDERDAWWQDVHSSTGVYYRLMMEHIKKVLADPAQVVPGYDPKDGYEIAGFAWLQGWNDMVNNSTYPDGGVGNRFALYSDLLAHFIRDVRKDLAAPQMPFVIGVMGVGGLKNQSASMLAFREAMAKPADMPEFKGKVRAVPTAPFWDAPLGEIDDKHAQVKQMSHTLRTNNKNGSDKDGTMTPEQQATYLKDFRAKLITPEDEALWKRGASNAGYHYLGCAKTFALMGEAFANAMLEMK